MGGQKNPDGRVQCRIAMYGFQRWAPADLRCAVTPLRNTLRLLTRAAASSWDAEFCDLAKAYWPVAPSSSTWVGQYAILDRCGRLTECSPITHAGSRCFTSAFDVQCDPLCCPEQLPDTPHLLTLALSPSVFVLVLNKNCNAVNLPRSSCSRFHSRGPCISCSVATQPRVHSPSVSNS